MINFLKFGFLFVCSSAIVHYAINDFFFLVTRVEMPGSERNSVVFYVIYFLA